MGVSSDWGPVIFATLVPLGLVVGGAILRQNGSLNRELGRIVAELRDHGRRLDVIETTALEGPARGRQRRREVERDAQGDGD